jgi:uncharacterized membrane protein YkvA (DUF1232 family)
MVWPGLILVGLGLALRLGLHGRTEHTAGVLIALAGLVILLLGVARAARRVRRLKRGLRYRDTEDFSGGIPPDYRTSRGKIFAVVVVLVYLFSPFDLATLEFLLPVGIVGDTSAIAWLLFTTGREVSRHQRARIARRRAVQAPRTAPRPRLADGTAAGDPARRQQPPFTSAHLPRPGRIARLRRSGGPDSL